jgi:membrane protein DedA with SNARE-associated domain
LEFDTLIRDYGYAAILVITFFEGETIVILAGAAAHFGYLEVPWIVASALAGGVSGDQLWYYVGRRWGSRLIARRRSWQERAERVYHHLRRHQDWLILSFRYYYGLRSVTPFAIGAAQVPRLRFFVLNLAGGVVWAITFTYAGYFVGEASEYLIEDFKRYGLYALGGLVLVGAAIVCAGRLRRRFKAAS